MNVTKQFIAYIFLVTIFIYLTLLLYPAISHKVSGTFDIHTVPLEYLDLKRMLLSDNTFYRTFWVPTKERFGFSSKNHPLVSADYLFDTNDPSLIIQALKKKSIMNQLREIGVKYVIIPSDPEKEIYITDRKYDSKKYSYFLRNLQIIPWLKQTTSFGKIVVFTLSGQQDIVWSPSRALRVTYLNNNPTEYTIHVQNAEIGNILILSENFDPNWELHIGRDSISSKPYHMLINSFTLPKNGNYSVKLIYRTQYFINIGLVITGLTFFGILATMFFL